MGLPSAKHARHGRLGARSAARGDAGGEQASDGRRAQRARPRGATATRPGAQRAQQGDGRREAADGAPRRGARGARPQGGEEQWRPERAPARRGGKRGGGRAPGGRPPAKTRREVAPPKGARQAANPAAALPPSIQFVYDIITPNRIMCTLDILHIYVHGGCATIKCQRVTRCCFPSIVLNSV